MRQPARSKPRPKPQRPPKPDRPEHLLLSPYSKLFSLGAVEAEEVYAEVAEELKRGDVAVAAQTLLRMILDLSYYDYDFEDEEREAGDPRSWTRQHALETFMLLGDAAHIGIEPLLVLLDEDDDDLQETAPFYYAAVGEPAIEPLTKVLLDPVEDTYKRAGAGSALAELGEQHPETRDRIVSLMEQALLLETNDKIISAMIIINLMDLGAKESLPLIEQAIAANKVDLSVVQMADIEEHFDLPRVTPYIDWTKEAGFDPDDPEAEDWSEEDEADEEPREVQVPYVAEVKVGRNEPCPCGSGKKYKKCCGA